MSFRKLLSGLTIPQQYVCVAREAFTNGLRVYLSDNQKNVWKEVTSTHVFLGYKPVIIALSSSTDEEASELICLTFSESDNFTLDEKWKGLYTSSKSLARLELRKAEGRIVGEKKIAFYTAVFGEHLFLSRFHQIINNSKERLRKNRLGNVSLPGNLHDQVRIAYSIPRSISLITIGSAEQMNMFPTDLHGAIDQEFYISSLRIGGKANQQVEMFKRLVVSEVEIESYKDAYALGKNHMRDLKGRSQFDCHHTSSRTFQIPLPKNVVRYKELTLIESFEIGIHRIHLYKIVDQEQMKKSQTLAHIHQYYAQWRLDNGVDTNFYLR